MRGFFSTKITHKTSHLIGKADKKKLNTECGLNLDIKKDYRLYILSNKAKVIKLDGATLFFIFHDKTFPTISNFDKSTYKTILLDEGAVGPLSRGADVMAPGILKFEESCPAFEKNEVVGIEIQGKGIMAVGLTLVDFSEMRRIREGPIIDIYHLKGDALDSGML